MSKLINTNNLHSILSNMKTKILSLTGQKDGTLQTNLNADMVDGVHVASLAQKDGTVQSNLNADMVDGVHSSQIPIKTTAQMIFYVSTSTGNDTNNGTTYSTPFKTISKAISLIPQIVNHTVVINIISSTSAPAVYDAPNLYGYFGSGSITIQGNTSNNANYMIAGLYVLNCNIPITVNGIKFVGDYDSGIDIENSSNVYMASCNITSESDTNPCIYVKQSNRIIITGSVLGGRDYGIYATYGSEVFSSGNSGSVNVYSIFSEQGSLVRANGTQCTVGGTYSGHTINGGEIKVS